MKTVLKILFGLILLILVLLIGTLAYVSATEDGVKRLLTLAQKYAPGELSWNSVSGTLIGPMTLQGLGYKQQDGLAINFSSSEFDWSPAELISGTLRINKLHIKDLDIALPEPTAQSQDTETQAVTLPDIRLPLAIEIQDIKLREIRVLPHQAQEPVVIKRLDLAAGADKETLQLVTLEVETPEATASLKGDVQATGSYPMNIAIDWDYGHQEFGQFNGGGELSGDLQSLDIDHSIEGPVNVNITGTLTDLLEEIAWDTDISVKSASLAELVPELQNTPLDAKIQSNGSLDQFTANADLVTDLQQTGPLGLTLSAAGNTEQLTIENALIELLSRPGSIQLQGEVDISQQSLDIDGSWNQLAWPLVGEVAIVKTPGGNFEFDGTSTDFIVAVQADLDHQQAGRISTELRARGDQKLIQLDELLLSSPDAEMQVTARGTFNLESQAFDAEGGWSDLSWPLQGDALVASPTGQFTASGLVTQYDFDLTTDVTGADIPAGSWHLKGSGSDKALKDFTLSGNTLDGQIEAIGRAGWQPEVNWDLTMASQELNPGVQWPQLPGRLNVKLASDGSLSETGLELVARIEELSGELNKHALDGKGDISLAGDELSISGLSLSSGRSRLEADGTLGQQWDLNWRLGSPDLGTLLPQLSGSVKGEGKLSGSRETPLARADLSVSQLTSGAIVLDQLSADLNLDVSGNQQSTLNLKGSGLQLSGQSWDSLSIAAAGTAERHKLTAEFDGSLAKLQTEMNGGIRSQNMVRPPGQACNHRH